MVKARAVASGMRWLVVNSSRINHLGKKPVNGGSPPNAIRVIIVMVESAGEITHIVPKSLAVFAVEVMKIRNMEVVING